MMTPPRLCRPAVLLVLLALAGAAVHAQPALTMKRVTTANWPMIELTFAVDCDGRPDFTAQPSNFRLYENGQEVPQFQLACADPSRRCAMTVGLVIDASSSMAGAGRNGAVAASRAFIDLMDGVADEAAVIFAGDTVKIMQRITTSRALLTQAVEQLTAQGTTLLWDGAYEALQLLIQNGPTQCRAVIMLSDGNDASSVHLPQTLIDIAAANAIRIFTIGLGSNINRATLQTIAERTGGVYYESPTPAQLVPIFTEISAIISQGFRECHITYRATCSEERFRTVDLVISDFCRGSALGSITYTISHTPVLPKPSITALGPLRFCQGGQVTLETDSGFASYLWSNGETTRRIDAYRTGRYTVIVSDTGGCTGTAHIDVVVDSIPLPVITASGPTSFCEGDSVTLDAGPGFTSYRWSTGATNQWITVHTSGTYGVSVTNAAGCANRSDDVRVDAWRLTRPVITGSASACRLSTVQYSVPRDSLVRYVWTVDGGVILSGDSTTRPLVRWDREGMGTLRLTMRHDSAACTLDVVQDVQVFSSIAVAITPDGPTTFCAGDSVMLDAGAGYHAYRWSTGDTTRHIAPRIGGRYRVDVHDDNGCAGSDSVTVTVVALPTPVVTVSPATEVCAGDTVTLDATPGFSSYRWSTGDTGQRIRLTRSATVSVTVTNTTGCEGTSMQVPVVVHPLPAAPVITQTDSTLSSSPAASYQWHRDGTAIPGATQRSFKATQDGRYRVSILDDHGCAAVSQDLELVLNQYTVLAIDCPAPRAYIPGEEIIMPLLLVDANLTQAGTRSFRIVLRYDRNAIAMAPGQGFAVVDQGRERLVSITGTRPAGMTQGTLASIRWIATVGDSACAHIAIDSLIWLDGMPRITLRDAHCTICTNICHAGGDRLYHASGGITTFTNHPNPFNASTRIEIGLSSATHARVRVLDLLGREVALLHDGDLSSGTHILVFESASLPGGIYACMLETPDGVIVRLMDMVK